MGRTFCSDRGGVMRGHNEELTRWRWARKRVGLTLGRINISSEYVNRRIQKDRRGDEAHR